MSASISGQVLVFFWCIVGGLIIGVIFDIFRLSRKLIPTSDMITYIEDILFWLLVGVIVLATVFRYNQGQLRGFVFLGMILGTVFYLMAFSNFIIKVITAVFNTAVKMGKTIIKILEKPIKIITSVLKVPTKAVIQIIKRAANKIYSIYKKVFNDIKRSKKIIKEKM